MLIMVTAYKTHGRFHTLVLEKWHDKLQPKVDGGCSTSEGVEERVGQLPLGG